MLQQGYEAVCGMSIDLSAFLHAADLIQPPEDNWIPHPHQIPPPGKWFGWLLMGGRGAGKTEADSRYFYEHVMGPPCVPHLPGGHWPAIIAPTLGDGVTSCVNGPSGLRKWDPKIKVAVTPGGAVVKFSNGAEAKIFGAHTPEDVERLRSGGNRCFARDMLILTEHGWLPVQQITNERVATRQGWKNIDRSGFTGHAEIYELLLSDGGKLRVTDDHQHILSDGTRKATKDLVPGDTLWSWPTNTAGSTSRFGKQKMARCLRDMTSTTRITTRTTINSVIWNALPRRTIGRSIMPSEALIGTPGVERPLGKTSCPNKLSARSAREISSPEAPSRLDSAVTNAEMPALSGRNVEANGSRGSVTTAERSTNTESAGHLVSVVRCVATRVQEATYCVRVPKLHELVVWTGASAVSSGNCLIWAEELAAWRYLDTSFQHMRYGLRLGPNPHWIASTTPKNRSLIKALRKQALQFDPEKEDELGRIVMNKATTKDNPYLPKHVSDMLYADYGGTRLGRQELLAEIVEDVEGALWTSSMIDSPRLRPDQMPERFDQIVVAVDPPASSTGDECGIVVVGKINRWKAYDPHDPRSLLPHGFVLADYSRQGTPGEWSHAAHQAYEDWGANMVVAEINNGGDMVKSTLRNVDDSMPITVVHATRGKARRAEPVVALYEQERVHHIGGFGLLEEQQTGFDANDPPDDWSPDRMDALVWGLSYLMVGRSQAYTTSRARDERLKGRR